MKHCESCKVDVLGTHTICPLCQNPLSGENHTNISIFPIVPTLYKKYQFLFKRLLIFTIFISFLVLFINYATTPHYWWSIFVILGFISIWISALTAIMQRNNVVRTIYYQVLLLSVLIVLWDWITGFHKWSFVYVLPTLYISAMITIALTAKFLKIEVEDSIFYLCIVSVLGIIPTLFILLQIVENKYPSLACIGISICCLLILMIYEGKEIIFELKKRLHF